MANRLNGNQETIFDLSARLVLIFALLLIVLSIAQVVYRFTLPTDGWSVYTEEVAETNWIFFANIVGAPSDLQFGDVLLVVDGLSVRGTASSIHMPKPGNWEKGGQVRMLVQRGAQQLMVDVPVVAWTWTAIWRLYLSRLDILGFTLGSLLFMLVGWYTFLQRPNLTSARALVLLSTAVGAASISGSLPDGLSVQFDQLAFIATGFFSYLIFGVLLAPALLTFSLNFPRPKRLIQRRPWLSLLPYTYGLLLLIHLLSGGNAVAGWLSTLLMFGASIVSLIHAAFTQRDTVSRAQLRWAISSFVLGIGLFMLNFPVAFNWVTDIAWINFLSFLASFGFAVIGIGFSVAVLRYHLFDIDVIIRRTLIYGALSLSLGLFYFGSVVVLQSLFEAISGQGSSFAIVISTLFIAALFSPLRRRIQNDIDRRFFRRKYNAEKTIESFSANLREALDLNELSERLLAVVDNTLEPEHISLWVKKVKR